MIPRIIALSVLIASLADAQIPFQTVYDQVRIDQRLGNQLPLYVHLRDEQGRDVTLGTYFNAKPVILSFVYFQCPMLCTQVLNGMVDGFRGLGFTAGKEFDVVTVSIDPRDTPAMATAKKGAYVASYGRPGVEYGWHFLTADTGAIRTLTEAAGFRYLYDTQSGQFAHASGIMVVTPKGRLARYFLGIEYAPKDLQFALMEASNGTIGSVVDKLLLLCYHYDPMTGKYGPVIANIFRAGGALTVLLIGGFVFVLLRRERRTSAGKQQEDT